jgi:hypothetical protein
VVIDDWKVRVADLKKPEERITKDLSTFNTHTLKTIDDRVSELRDQASVSLTLLLETKAGIQARNPCHGLTPLLTLPSRMSIKLNFWQHSVVQIMLHSILLRRRSLRLVSVLRVLELIYSTRSRIGAKVMIISVSSGLMAWPAPASQLSLAQWPAVFTKEDDLERASSSLKAMRI